MLLQEILKILPDSCQHLSLCSKAWSDATYLDEIHNQFKEPLSNADKRDVNLKAKQYAEKVETLALLPSITLREVVLLGSSYKNFDSVTYRNEALFGWHAE